MALKITLSMPAEAAAKLRGLSKDKSRTGKRLKRRLKKIYGEFKVL